jgi:hypothetical protein
MIGAPYQIDQSALHDAASSNNHQIGVPTEHGHGEPFWAGVFEKIAYLFNKRAQVRGLRSP